MDPSSFALEQLEGRTLFCAAGSVAADPIVTTAAMVATSVATTAATNPLAGAFNVSGTYTQPLGNPDTGAQYKFSGTGKTAALGSFKLAGHMQLPGFIASARASGVFTITTSKGTLTLSVHGPQQSPGILPPYVSFTISKGTGSYAKSTGKGQLVLSASSTTHKFVFRFNQK